MEIEARDGTKIELSNTHRDKTVFGRASASPTADRSVSRRHVAFQVVKSRANQTPPRVSFEVLGKNPLWVRRREDEGVRVFRRSEKGELSEGDCFCVSAKGPNWFVLRRIGDEDGEARVSEDEDEIRPSSRIGSEFEGLEGSDIDDPVKEFGFIVMGKEFDQYPKHMIRDVKSWDWFLEDDSKKRSDDDEEEFEKRKKRKINSKRKKGDEDNGDEDWTDESDKDEASEKARRPNYATRSKERVKQFDKDDQGSNRKSISKDRGEQFGKDDQGSNRKFMQKKVYNGDEKDDKEDEEDETLGGFIVGDEEREEEEMTGDEDEEEEEFVEDDEDDE